MPSVVKPKLLAIELWQVGDLAIASPFLRKACEQFDVTLLAKPFALDLQQRFWPEVKVIPFYAPWTRFSRKYDLWSWPWLGLARLVRQLRRERFDIAVSARWDPRNHYLLFASGAKRRLGFPRLGSQLLLTESLPKPDPEKHTYEQWRALAQRLDLDLPHVESAPLLTNNSGRTVIIHTGAGQPVRVWPLERYQRIAAYLRAQNYDVRILCDPDQTAWWRQVGETDVVTPATISELLDYLSGAAALIGNDSGPGHLAAFLGVPTFTLFGPQLPVWFVPIHPQAEYIEGKPCPYKPCSDYCRFTTPHCLWNITEQEVRDRLDNFLHRHVPSASAVAV